MIIGVTGGIGSGKSCVSKFLAMNGIPVYVADKEAKRLMATSAEIRVALKILLGEETYIGQELNKVFVAKKIFADEILLRKVNEIVHPVVRRDFKKWREIQRTAVVAVESAILLESGLSSVVDKVLVVIAPLEERISRVMVRDGIDREEVISRINAQITDEERLNRADFVVSNGENEAITPRLLMLINQIIP